MPVGNVIGVVTETEAVRGEGTTTTATDIMISRRVPPIPDAQKEVAPGHGEIQSHTRVEMSLLVVDTEAVTGEFRSHVSFLYILVNIYIFWLPYLFPMSFSGDRTNDIDFSRFWLTTLLAFR